MTFYTKIAQNLARTFVPVVNSQPMSLYRKNPTVNFGALANFPSLLNTLYIIKTLLFILEYYVCKFIYMHGNIKVCRTCKKVASPSLAALR